LVEPPVAESASEDGTSIFPLRSYQCLQLSPLHIQETNLAIGAPQRPLLIDDIVYGDSCQRHQLLDTKEAIY
jgi:hypothetical protein